MTNQDLSVKLSFIIYSKYGPRTTETSSVRESTREYRTLSNNLDKRSEEPTSSTIRTYQPAWKR
ncbi:MAG: hypothetical protein ACXACP_08170 [Candidatus Hodarchaeales archaeon]